MELVVSTSINVLVLSSMYILVALGFAFLFNMLGIINFTHGAIYMVGGYLGFLFVSALGFNPWLAMLLSTVIIATFGLFLERFCFRPFVQDMNRLIMVCIAIVVILQTTVNIIAGTETASIPAFAEGVLGVGSFSVSYERIITFVIGAVLLGAVIWFVNRTKWGQQMQAISQDRLGASLQGINIHRVSGLASFIGCGLAAVAGCLVGAYLNLWPFMGDLMLVKVLILVILAGVGSLWGIIITGLILGGLDSVLPVVTSGTASDAIAVSIVVVLLLIRPQGFFGREITAESQVSTATTSRSLIDKVKWAKPVILAGLVILIALLPILVSSQYMLHIFILTLIYMIAAVSLRTITISGQFPLAHAAFMGIGAYSSGMLAKWIGWSPWLTIPLGALVAMGIGMLIGHPFARLRALYYMMGSLFFGIGVVYIIQAGGTWTGGTNGLTGIPSLFPAGTTKVAYYYFFLGLAVISIIALYRFEFSRIGINLKAIAQSQLAASSVGINEAWYRILAVGVGCFFVGLAGAGYAHYNPSLPPISFNFMATLWLVMYVLIGGIDSFAGPIIGTAILILVPEFFRDLKTFSPYISAGILLIIAYLMPKGLAGVPSLVRSWYLDRRKG
jgi:branched-subunit amino acid ABC-type transport system permease component